MGYIHFPHLVQITLLRENVEPIFQANSDFSSNTTVSSSHAINANNSTIHTHLSSNTSGAALKDQWGNSLPQIGPKSKIFELNTVNEVAKVCLIYDSSSSNNPKMYLLELDSFKWVFLADNFSEYLRMAIAHLGLPYWELCFASFGLPSWTEVGYFFISTYYIFIFFSFTAIISVISSSFIGRK